MSRVPVFVLTGFLGSGKTTWLNAALRSNSLGNAMVIVNEFGQIGIDQDLIAVSTDSVTLLENGCLCCAARGDLMDALDGVWLRRLSGNCTFDRVVIETSGLAEPSPIIAALSTEEARASRYRFAGVITVVDSANGLVTIESHRESQQQIAVADRILLTKVDMALALGTDRQQLEACLRKLNPRADILTTGPALRFDRLFAETDGDMKVAGSTAEGSLTVATTHHHENKLRVSSFSILRDSPLPIAMIEMLMDALRTNGRDRLLRVKGLVNVKEILDKPVVVHGAQQLIHPFEVLNAWPSDDRRTRLVFITWDWPEEEVTELFDYVEKIAQRTQTVRGARASL